MLRKRIVLLFFCAAATFAFSADSAGAFVVSDVVVEDGLASCRVRNTAGSRKASTLKLKAGGRIVGGKRVELDAGAETRVGFSCAVRVGDEVSFSLGALKVLMIGNSFSACVLSEMPKVCASLGLELDLCSMKIGGCSLARHMENVNCRTNKPYKVRWSYASAADGGEVPFLRLLATEGQNKSANIPEMLGADAWDIVTIQQCSKKSWMKDSYHPYGDDLVATIRRLSPRAEIVMQETWSYAAFAPALSEEWKISQDEMYERLHDAYAEFAATYGFRIIPTGTAVQEWRRQLPVRHLENSLDGDVCGGGVFTEKDGRWTAKGDFCHLNRRGHYLQALLWTAKLFDADIRSCSYRSEYVTEAEAALMKRIAASLAEKADLPDDLQARAQAIADMAVRNGLQGALQFCAYRDGKCIVDVWAGTMTTNPGAAKIDGHSLFPIFSTEKPLLATAVHRAVEQGKMSYEAPLSTWWPEFVGDGKENLTLGLTLGYRSGMPPRLDTNAFPTVESECDWQRICDWAAAVKPIAEPGVWQKYMSKSYAWYLGHPLEVAMGMPLNDVLVQEVLKPCGIENDFYFAADDAALPRIVTVYKSRSFETMNDDRRRRMCLPSAWAVANARSIARFYNRLCGFDGRPPLIRRETLDAALVPCRHPCDPVPEDTDEAWHMIFGMGYGLWGERENLSRVFGHGGVGGSEGLCDRSQRLTVGFTCNFGKDVGRVRALLYSVVGLKWRYWKDADADIQNIQMTTVAR